MDGRTQPSRIAIALDGPAASGKTTVGRALARELGYTFLDTGLMYRAFSLAAQRAGIGPEDEAACSALASGLRMDVEPSTDTRILLDGEDVTPLLRSREVEAAVSAYSAIPGVRTALIGRQREVAEAGGVVLAGRDIGTVVLPGAPVKIFLDASEEARGQRRERESGADAAAAVLARDRVDRTRVTAPLAMADDAFVLDTTGLSIDEAVAQALELVRCALA